MYKNDILAGNMTVRKHPHQTDHITLIPSVYHRAIHKPKKLLEFVIMFDMDQLKKIHVQIFVFIKKKKKSWKGPYYKK